VNKLITYGFLMLFAATNCVEPYDFIPGKAGNFLVVSGTLTQTNEINIIKLSKSTAFGSNAAENPVETAEVTLFDSSGNSELLINEGNGYYAHYGYIVNPVVGGEYYIEIAYGTKLYRTAPQVLPDPIVPDSVSYEVGRIVKMNSLGNEVTYDNIDININTPINQKTNVTYLRWNVDESWSFGERQCHPLKIPKSCYINNIVNDNHIYLFSGEGISGKYLFGKKVVSKNILEMLEFVEKHYFNVHQYTLTQEAYKYWERAKELSNPAGDIFDVPPATLPGNVFNTQDPDEIVLGYFEVSAKSIARVALYRSSLAPITVPTKEECLLIKNSTTIRPAYWD